MRFRRTVVPLAAFLGSLLTQALAHAQFAADAEPACPLGVEEPGRKDAVLLPARTAMSWAVALWMMFGPTLGTSEEPRTVPPDTLAALLAGPHLAPVAGAERGDVTLVEYFDYNCPVCRALEPELRTVLAADPKVRLVRKDWPIFGAGSVYAALCSFAAARQGHYQLAHDALMSSSKDLDSKSDVLAVLAAAGLDVAFISADVVRHESEYREVLARTQREAHELELRGTPGLIVASQLVAGRADARELQRLIAQARSRG